MVTNRTVVLSMLMWCVLAVAVSGGKLNDKTHAPETELAVFVVATDVGLGSARIPIKILSDDRNIVEDATGQLEMNYSPPDSDERRLVTNLQWREWPIKGGSHTATMQFDSTGLWKVRVRLVKDERVLFGETGVLVKSKTDAPNVGEAAPLSKTKVAPQDGDLMAITTSHEPDPDLYIISFDAAVATGRPTVVTLSLIHI